MFKIIIKKSILVISIIFILNNINAQTQLGGDIDGEAANNSSGWAVSMPNATTVAIGAPSNDEVASGAGHVRVFSWNGTSWVQKGSDVDGQYAFDELGTVVSMPDENTFGAGEPGNAQSVNPFGRIKIYSWNGSSWTQKGSTLNGLSAGERFGFALSMGDNNTFAVGSIGGSTWTLNPSGKVIIYEWNGIDWAQKGNTIVGEASGDQFGYTVSMPNSNTVAISAPFNDGSFNNAGHVRIFEWNGSSWVQKGNDIDGEAAGDNSGWSIDMPDPNTIAIGAPKNAGGIYLNGHTRIYSWNGTSWIQKGVDINGTNVGENLGFSVSMPDANNIAIGAPYNGTNNTNSGKVVIYSWNGTQWVQNGNSIYGEAQDDESGKAICMPDVNTVAIGSHRNSGNGNDAGHVRIFEITPTLGVNEYESELIVKAYPNPTNENFTIDLGKEYDTIQLTIRNILGQEVHNKNYKSSRFLDLQLTEENGIYFIEIVSNNKSVILKIIKK